MRLLPDVFYARVIKYSKAKDVVHLNSIYADILEMDWKKEVDYRLMDKLAYLYPHEPKFQR